jgi:F-type H+-transporting ATPase subunit epsilon
MVEKILFDLVSPKRLLVSDEVRMVTLPGVEGDLGVMAGHEPLIVMLRPGVIEVKDGLRGDERFFVLGGFAEVSMDKLTVLVEEVFAIADTEEATVDRLITDVEKSRRFSKSKFEQEHIDAALAALRQLRATI